MRENNSVNYLAFFIRSVIVDRSVPFNKEFNISFASGTHFLEHVVLTTTFSIKVNTE